MKYIKLYEQREPQRKVKRRSGGSVESEQWRLDGKRHREDGPAWIGYREDGSVEKEGWWLDGEQVEISTQEEFEVWKYMKSVGLV